MLKKTVKLQNVDQRPQNQVGEANYKELQFSLAYELKLHLPLHTVSLELLYQKYLPKFSKKIQKKQKKVFSLRTPKIWCNQKKDCSSGITETSFLPILTLGP